MIKKITSQIGDIFQYKTDYPVVLRQNKQKTLLGFIAVFMIAITIFFANIIQDLNQPSFLFLMSNVIFYLIYLSHVISNERIVLSKSRIKYPLILGIIPSFWSVIGPYIIANTIFVLLLSNYFSFLVIIIQIILMVILILSSVLVYSLQYISFYRFIKSSVNISILLYLIPTLFEGLYFSVAYVFSLAIVIVLDLMRYSFNHIKPSHPLYHAYIKIISYPIFWMTMGIAMLYGITMRYEIQNHAIIPTNPIIVVPNIKETITIDLVDAHTLIELPEGRIFARGLYASAILDSDYQIIHEYEGSFFIRQADPYILTEIRRLDNTWHTWKINPESGQLEPIEYLHLYDLSHYIKIVEMDDETYYIFAHPDPELAYFDIYRQGSVERHSFINDDGSHAFQKSCHALIHDREVYRYYHCVGNTGQMKNDGTYQAAYLLGNHLLIEEYLDGYPVYRYADINNSEFSLQIDLENQWIRQLTRNDTSLLILTTNSVLQLNSNLQIKDRVPINPSYVSLIHGEVLMWDIEHSGGISHYDLLNTASIKKYMIAKNYNVGTRIFLPFFIITMLTTTTIQFRKVPRFDKYTLFGETWSDQDM